CTTHEKWNLVGGETEKNCQTCSGSNEELSKLTGTANGEVVFVVTQKRPQVDRQTVIGKGKLEELIQLTDAYEAELVICNHELT
ncbi:GTPase HflX, partial [Enterococcus faecalis]|nr:GTPase HflX [Enterococcus faecalis]